MSSYARENLDTPAFYPLGARVSCEGVFNSPRGTGEEGTRSRYDSEQEGAR